MAPDLDGPEFIIGIDPSLTNTGITVLTRSAANVCMTNCSIRTSPDQSDWARINELLEAIIGSGVRPLTRYGTVAVAIESLTVSRFSGKLFERAYLLGLVIWHCIFVLRVPVYLIQAGAAKRFATGSGSATKTQMVEAARAKWSLNSTDHNIADSCVLSRYTAQVVWYKAPLKLSRLFIE